ncbi:DNA-3-methyladenine glycosylase I [bacterium SCSIO 12643]|nr:DNA-3-methyladenine glycosylase I [bacterium SCSIO 12643]
MENKQNIKRCEWCSNDPIYQNYHDQEWGVPKYDDHTLFEMLILEGAQAGLSWITILKRRENYRQAFDGFDIDKVANYGSKEEAKLLNNSGIIRNKLKIKSAIRNAQVFKQIQAEYGSFSAYLWRYVNHKPMINDFSTAQDVPVTDEIAKVLSKDLKKRGMSFVGPVIMYSYMQSIGMVNDHTLDCFKRKN